MLNVTKLRNDEIFIKEEKSFYRIKKLYITYDKIFKYSSIH